jgi:hypothetical protein
MKMVFDFELDHPLGIFDALKEGFVSFLNVAQLLLNFSTEDIVSGCLAMAHDACLVKDYFQDFENVGDSRAKGVLFGSQLIPEIQKVLQVDFFCEVVG